MAFTVQFDKLPTNNVLSLLIPVDNNTAAQREKAVSAYLTNEADSAFCLCRAEQICSPSLNTVLWVIYYQSFQHNTLNQLVVSCWAQSAVYLALVGL